MKNALFIGLLMLGVSVSTAQVKASEKTGKVESVSYTLNQMAIQLK